MSCVTSKGAKDNAQFGQTADRKSTFPASSSGKSIYGKREKESS